MDEIPELVEDLQDDGKGLSVNGGKFKNQAHEVYKVNETNNDRSKPELKKVPITIVTGYLGSGKSTLLEQIAKGSKIKLAVIVNEFGDSSAIEKSVTIRDSENNDAIQEWLDLGNGCICCSVKNVGVAAIEQLLEKSNGEIDYILLETTGIADPAPIAKMFWLDEGLSSSIYIDGIVTVLDASNILTCLDDKGGHWHFANNFFSEEQFSGDKSLASEEKENMRARLEEGITTAHLQIALADVILLNKTDKIENSFFNRALENISNRVRGINSTAPIYSVNYGDIDLNNILNLHAFEGNTDKLTSSFSFQCDASYHDQRISTISLTFPFVQENIFDRIESFLQHILWEEKANDKPISVHRVKGIVVCINESNQYLVKVVQGVRDTYDIIHDAKLLDSITENKLVLIGKGLEESDIQSEFQKFSQLLV